MSGPVVHCAFRYACPAEWDALTSTRNPAVRFCAVCRRDVHLCHSDEDLRRHAAAGHCIAIERKQARDGEGALVGMPDPAFLEFEIEGERKP